MSGAARAAADADRSANPALDPADALARAFQAGDAEALLALREALQREVLLSTLRPRRQLSAMPGVEQADLWQEAWLALAEAARVWQPAADGPFRPFALRALRRSASRLLRRSRVRRSPPGLPPLLSDAPHEPDAEPPETRVPDSGPAADAGRWADVALMRSLAAALPAAERDALLLRVLGERRIQDVAAEMGVTRRGAERMLRLAVLRARALAGEPPPPDTPEASVLAAVHAGAAERGEVPRSAWLEAHTGFGRRRVRVTLKRLVELGYLRPAGRWLVVR